jgi:hypothetical protein
MPVCLLACAHPFVGAFHYTIVFIIHSNVVTVLRQLCSLQYNGRGFMHEHNACAMELMMLAVPV